MTQAVPGFWNVADEDPQRIAVVGPDGKRISYGQLVERVNQTSNAMVDAGIRPGDLIAILARNHTDVVVLMLAATQVGAYYSLINSHLAAPEVSYVLSDSGAVLLFVDEWTRSIGEKAVAQAGIEPLQIVDLNPASEGISIDNWIARHATTRPLKLSTGAPMLYTSGTSGRPKGVRPTLRDGAPDHALSGLVEIVNRIGVGVADDAIPGVFLATSPLYHAAPLYKVLLSLQLGHKLVIMDRFEPMRALELIEEHGVTWTQVVPTMMARWMALDPNERKARDVSSLRWLVHAAAPCSVPLKRAVLDWLGPVVYEYYASTEGGGSAIGPQDWLDHPGSVGKAWRGAEIRILGDDRKEVPCDEIGSIYFRSTSTFQYHNDPDKTAEARLGDFVTVGDLGWMDVNGYLYIADRRSDLILSGGVNIYPAEVESVLLEHPDVVDAAVIGIPEDDLGEVVHAVVQPAESVDHESLIASLRELCEANLGSQKRPRSFEFRAEVPRSEAGKLLRRVLRDEHRSSVGRSQSQRWRNRVPVEAGHVLTFARAIGDPNLAWRDPIWCDAGQGEEPTPAPPTFLAAAVQFEEKYHNRPTIGEPWRGSGRNATCIPPLTPEEAASRDGDRSGGGTTLHAEQEYIYHRPVRVGDVLEPKPTEVRTWIKEGRRGGHLHFSERTTHYHDAAGDPVVTVRSVGVRTEKLPTPKDSA